MKILPIAFAFILLSSIALAQQVDKAMLVSDTTSADMLIAKAASQKSGAPVFVLENGTLTDDVRTELARLDIKTVILIGGPAVIGNSTEAELERTYTVIRLWGHERTGTAVEVAKYFWTEARCAVLADDTKDSEADTELQTDAVQIAVTDGCVFLPVPRGRAPSGVISLLGDLKTTHATFVGMSPAEFRAKLSHLNRSEITGDRAQRENATEDLIRNKTREENATLRLMIIAAPHWRHALGHAGHAGKHTVVRIISGTDGVPALINLISTRNITDVRVLGHPALASDIAAQLKAGGINATKISGERASEVAINAARESWSEWQQRRKEAFANETNVFAKSKIKRQVNALLTRLERELNRLEAGNNSANQTAAALLQKRIDSAQSQLGAVRDYINNDNLDTAKRRIARLYSDVMKIRWLYRMQLNVDARSEVAAEES